MFEIVEIQNHGKIKYQIIFKDGKHLCYINDRGEASAVLHQLNSK